MVITGDGGLGKTRLALELYLESGYEGYLIQNKATVETIETLIQKAKDENRKIVFLIDYIEELSGIFDSIHQSITRNSDGFAYLITTTRTLSSMHSALPGPRNLNATACKEVALNDRLLETWRREVCAEILRKAGLPQHVCEGFSNLDIPVIASLLAYDYVHLGTVDDENIRSDDGGWLNRRLLRHVSEKLSEADVVFLLTLYPFDDGFRQLLSKSMQETSDELYRNGWVSTVSSADGTKEWRLGHDLLADISLVSLLLKETKSILRFEMINDLSERAKALKASQRFGRSLARALNRLVASTWADEVMDTLMACVEPLAVSNENQNHALITCKQSLLSLSISLGDKIRILRELSGLSLWQLQELSKVFTDELNQFVRFRAEHAEVIKQLLLREACGSKVCLAEMQKEYQITIPPIAIASAVPPRLPGVFIPSFHELATSTGITLPTVVDSTSLQAVTHPEDVDFFDYFNQNMPILSQQSLYSDVAQEVAEKALLSLSLDPRNKLRVLTQLPQLSEWQLKKLIATFDKEVEVIRKLLATEESSIQELIRKAALGNANYLTLIADRYQTHVQFESLPDAVPQQNGGFLATMPGAQEIAKLDQNSRIWIARQMLFAVTKSTGNASRNLSNYDVIIECFADDRQPQVREVVAQATFQQAQAIAARDKNPQAYNLVIERFANDQHNPVREYAAIAASNLAQAIATRDKNPQAYDWMIERFSDDQYGPIREVAANAAHAKVLRIAERDKSPQVYDWMIERFSNDQYLPIKKLLILARADQIGWFVVFNRFDDAISNGERFLSDANAPDTQKTVVAFLIWMAKPNIEYRQRCELLLSTMQGADFNWTFDEFTEKIETLNDDDQVFARRMVSHLESKAPTQ